MKTNISIRVADAVASARANAAGVSTSDIVSVVDLTTLGDLDTDADVRRICERAREHRVAAVCVFPRFVKLAAALLKESNVRVSTVSVDFPHGQACLRTKLAGIEHAVSDGADEIDIVAARGDVLAMTDVLSTHTAACVEAAGRSHIKVILETGQLGDVDTMYRAAREALAAGAHFVKTSTGKSQPAATPEATAALLLAIRDHGEETGQLRGCKPAGGIRTPADAALLVALAWKISSIRPGDAHRFRIGASSLLNALR